MAQENSTAQMLANCDPLELMAVLEDAIKQANPQEGQPIAMAATMVGILTGKGEGQSPAEKRWSQGGPKRADTLNGVTLEMVQNAVNKVEGTWNDQAMARHLFNAIKEQIEGQQKNV